MGLFNIYTLFTGSMNDFVNKFKDNEAVYNQAKMFWKTLEGNAILYWGVFIAFGIILAALYYTWFNNMPGRHYKPKWWWLFMLVEFVITLFVTYGLVQHLVPARVQGAVGIEWRLAIGNAIYSAVFYLIVSCAWCIFLPTNAYRFIKK
jgi:hypothetical protein